MNFFTSQGRDNRIAYALHVFGGVALLVVLIFGRVYLLNSFDAGSWGGDLCTVILFVTFAFVEVDGIFATIRRLHDLNRPGSHYFLLMIPFYNMVLAIRLLAEQGTNGRNKYDADFRPVSPAAQEKDTDEGYVCSNCGKEIQFGNPVCGHCGEKLEYS